MDHVDARDLLYCARQMLPKELQIDAVGRRDAEVSHLMLSLRGGALRISLLPKGLTCIWLARRRITWDRKLSLVQAPMWLVGSCSLPAWDDNGRHNQLRRNNPGSWSFHPWPNERCSLSCLEIQSGTTNIMTWHSRKQEEQDLPCRGQLSCRKEARCFWCVSCTGESAERWAICPLHPNLGWKKWCCSIELKEWIWTGFDPP